MTYHALHEVSTAAPAEDTAPFLPLLEVAGKIGKEPTTVRRWIWNDKVQARQRDDGRGYEVNVATLPPKYRAAFAGVIATAPTGPHAVAPGEAAPRYSVAPERVRERAELRYEAVLSLDKARAAREAGECLAEAERRWLRNFRRSHAGLKVSIRSVKAWAQALREAAGSIDALVDGNDGVKQRGSRIPAPAKRMFRDEYLRAHQPNVRLIYDNVLAVAAQKDWGAMPSYDTFWRFSRKEIPKLVKRLLRDCADTPRRVLPHVRRDPTTVAAYHTIQSDHREIDVPVRCDKGCEVCTGKKPKGHFPIWTAFIDIRSRRILGSDISIDAPDSNRVLSVFRRVSDENGLTRRVYLDNGSDYRKAFGKRLRKNGKSEWDGPNEEAMQARFAPVGIEVIYAIPYNAQAKMIESMFRTFRHRFDENFEAYRGTLGNKSELARELYYHPSELPTISELAFLLQLAIDDYNASRPHSGRGMDGRTPDAVFYDPEIRMPYRKPDKAWGFLFFEPVKGGRIVDVNGIRHDGQIYRLESLQKHLEYFGERVDVRINPDDQRVAMIFDGRTRAYVCDALLDGEATYDTRDERTRQLIARVFSDGKALVRMARMHVEGAQERLAEYKRARIEYLVRRAEENEARRREAQAALSASATPVTVIGEFSAVARDRDAAQPIELTAQTLAEVLDADDAAREESATTLCVVSARKRKVKAETGRRRHDHTLRMTDIAERLGTTATSLYRYQRGVNPWPAGLKERFDAYVKLRSAGDAEIAASLPVLDGAAPAKPRRTRSDGEFSWRSIAQTLGMHWKLLERCRKGERSWPEGKKEQFEELVRQRMHTA